MLYTSLASLNTPHVKQRISLDSDNIQKEEQGSSNTKLSKTSPEHQKLNKKETKNNNFDFYKLQNLEKKLLLTQGLIIGDNIWSYNVRIQKENGYIHTLEAGRGNPQKVVLVHGFGATSIFWFKVIPLLSKKFHVYAIDQLGTGQSSHPEFNINGFEETVDFFCGAIEEWRKALNIENFILMGHSFGGYTVARYALKFNPPIKTLHLLSPAGFTGKSDEEITQDMKSGFGIISAKIFQSVFHMLQTLNFTPFQITNVFGRQDSIHRFLRGPRLKMTKMEGKILSEYYYGITELKISSDKGLGNFLNYGRYSKNPLIKDLKTAIDKGGFPKLRVYYGENDWMDSKHSIKVNEELKCGISIEIVSDCGHQIQLQKPFETAKLIFDEEKEEMEEEVGKE